MKTYLTGTFILISILTFSQNINISAGYSYLYSKQFDRNIQIYKFSRPLLKEKQPLLDNGICTSLSYLFKSDKI